jgi:uncharacterized protein YjaG (DUF416 family)
MKSKKKKKKEPLDEIISSSPPSLKTFDISPSTSPSDDSKAALERMESIIGADMKRSSRSLRKTVSQEVIQTVKKHKKSNSGGGSSHKTRKSSEAISTQSSTISSKSK